MQQDPVSKQPQTLNTHDQTWLCMQFTKEVCGASSLKQPVCFPDTVHDGATARDHFPGSRDATRGLVPVYIRGNDSECSGETEEPSQPKPPSCQLASLQAGQLSDLMLCSFSFSSVIRCCAHSAQRSDVVRFKLSDQMFIQLQLSNQMLCSFSSAIRCCAHSAGSQSGCEHYWNELNVFVFMLVIAFQGSDPSCLCSMPQVCIRLLWWLFFVFVCLVLCALFVKDSVFCKSYYYCARLDLQTLLSLHDCWVFSFWSRWNKWRRLTLDFPPPATCLAVYPPTGVCTSKPKC